jgi:RNA-directed DNA polymerase
MMHEHEKSDAAIGAEKLANKVERSAAEPVEQRAAAKGNADQHKARAGRRTGKACHRRWSASSG